MAFRPLRILLPVLLLAAGGAGFAALKASRPERQPVPSEERAWLVSIETVKPAALAPTVALFGRVDSPRLASLSAAITADVVEVPVLEGERVEAGALLVRLDDRDMVLERLQREADVADIRAQLEAERQRFERDQASLANEKALLALTERAVRRAEELASTRVGSAAQLDDARQAAERQRMALADRRFAVREHDARRQQLEARLARAEALLGKAVLDLSRSQVSAPFAGRVTEVMVAPGDRVRAGDVLLSMYDVERVEIRAQLPTRLLAQVRRAMGAGASLYATLALDGQQVRARLDRLAARVEPGSGGVDALFRVEGDTDGLPIGRIVELVLELPPERDVVALPMEALYGTDRVFLLDGERMREVAVERVGERRAGNETRVLLRGPQLVAGARVVTTQLPNAIDGLRVKVAGGG